MDLLKVATIGSLLWTVMGKLSKKRRGLGPPRLVDATEIEMFTSVEKGDGSAERPDSRRFDRVYCKAFEVLLRGRSAREIPASEVGIEWPCSVYEVVPIQMGLPVAAEVLDHATRHGLVVLGSLSLYLINSGEQVPMILVVGSAGTEVLAAAGKDPSTNLPLSQLARLYSVAEQSVIDTPAPEAVPEAEAPTDPAPAAASAANGAVKHADMPLDPWPFPPPTAPRDEV